MSDLSAEVSSLESRLSSALSELQEVGKERDVAVAERQHLMEENKEVGEGGRGEGSEGVWCDFLSLLSAVAITL